MAFGFQIYSDTGVLIMSPDDNTGFIFASGSATTPSVNTSDFNFAIPGIVDTDEIVFIRVPTSQYGIGAIIVTAGNVLMKASSYDPSVSYPYVVIRYL